MARKIFVWVIALVGLPLSGALSGLFQFDPPIQTIIAESEDFRTWFWTNRSHDLAVQAVLIFTATLGIFALLPKEKEDEP